MNRYRAAQRESDSRWVFARKDEDDDTSAAGYCEGWRRQRQPRSRQHKRKYHADGHTTAEEAAACYRDYLLDQRLSLNRQRGDLAYECRVCQTVTPLFARLDDWVWWLCEQHNNRETVETLFTLPIEISTTF